MPLTATASSTSGGVLTALGLGSGLDISTLVSELVTAEMSAVNARATREQTSITTQLSAVATLKSALSTFQSSVNALSAGTGFASRSAVSSNEDIFTAAADTSAVVGTYRVEVNQLAQGQQLITGSFTDSNTTPVGTGTLSFTVGAASFSVNIDSNNSTLAGIRDAINYAPENASVSATIVNGTGGPRLVLSSLRTGVAETINITSSEGDGGLTQLNYSAGVPGAYTVDQAAQDAIITVAGIEHHSSSNKVTDVLDGVTLNLQSADEDVTYTLKISNDSAHVTSLVGSFVTAYNTLRTQLATLNSYDSSAGTTGPMFGDSLLSGIERQMQRALGDVVSSVSGQYNSLASLGITTDANGKMVLSSAKLERALAINFSAVSNVFSASDGIVARLDTFLDSVLAGAGSVSSRSASLDVRQNLLDDQKEFIEMRTAKVRERYLMKFNAMDTLLAQLQSTGDYLSQQFDALTRDTR